MAYERRGWKGAAKATTVSGTLAAGATTIPCSDLSTWTGAPTNGIATAVISRSIPGQATTDEEIITFSGIAGNSLTGVLRGQGGTVDQQHASGATIEHSSQVRDFDEANAHIADTTLDHHTQYLRTNGSRALTGDLSSSAQITPTNHCCRVYRTATLSVADSTMTTVAFDGERYDIGGLHAAGTTSRLTAVTAGKYLIVANVEWAANATGDRNIRFMLNGATIIGNVQGPPIAGLLTIQSLATVYHLAATDYVELQVYQNSGGALNLDAAAAYSPEFGMTYLCA